MIFLAAWAWIKKYWEVVLGGFTLLLGVLFGMSLQRKRTPGQQANPVKEEANKEAESQTRKAENQAAEQKAEAVKEHDADLADLVKKEQEATAEVHTDADKTNTYLQDVSKAIRGEK